MTSFEQRLVISYFNNEIRVIEQSLAIDSKFQIVQLLTMIQLGPCIRVADNLMNNVNLRTHII